MEYNFFEQFEGADLDRLSDCLKAIRLAGLRTDKYTQAGVNQSSGNVWFGLKTGRGVFIARSALMFNGLTPAASVAKNSTLTHTPKWNHLPKRIKTTAPHAAPKR